MSKNVAVIGGRVTGIVASSGGLRERAGWNGPGISRAPSVFREASRDPVKAGLMRTVEFHKREALRHGIDTPRGQFHVQKMNGCKEQLHKYNERSKTREVISNARDKSTMYDPFDKQAMVSAGMAAKAINEARRGDEALRGHHLYKGMLKVAQRHADQGRPRVADTIRRKAKKFQDDTTAYGKGR